MKLRGFRLDALRLPLRAPLETAHGPIDARDVWVLRLVDAEGRVGLGEAAPIAGFPGESFEAAGRALRTWCEAAIDARASVDCDGLAEHAELLEAPVAAGALACALLDLEAQARGLPLSVWLTESAGLAAPPESVAVNALLGEAEEARLLAAAEHAVARGFRTLKVKLGVLPLDGDLRRVAALRHALGAKVRLRGDANAGWSASLARAACERMAEFDLEWLEQPVPDRADLFELAAASPVPIAADESVAEADGAVAALEDGRCRALVLKAALLGGPRRAVALARQARDCGMRVAVTTLIDSAIGRAMALHTAAACDAAFSPEERVAHGLSTAGLLADDLAPPAADEDQPLRRVPARPGLGFQPEEEALERLRVAPSEGKTLS